MTWSRCSSEELAEPPAHPASTKAAKITSAVLECMTLPYVSCSYYGERPLENLRTIDLRFREFHLQTRLRGGGESRRSPSVSSSRFPAISSQTKKEFGGTTPNSFLVEVAGIEPASFAAHWGLLRAQSAQCFSPPAFTQTRCRRGQSLFVVPQTPATGVIG